MADDTESVLNIPEDVAVPSMDFAKHVAGQSRASTRLAMIALGVMFALGLAGAMRTGLFKEDHLPLMIAAALSVAAVWLYNFTAVLFAAGSRRRRLFVLTTFGVMLPYVLGFYVMLARGGWGLVLVSREFDWPGLGWALLWTGLGVILLIRLRRLVEIRLWVDEAVGRALPQMPAQKQSGRSRKRRR